MTQDGDDVEMGARLLQWLRQDLCSDIPVVVVSAYLDDQMLRRLSTLGPVTVIDKPCDPNDICQAVAAVLADTDQGGRRGDGD